jgi:hypothetical protein
LYLRSRQVLIQHLDDGQIATLIAAQCASRRQNSAESTFAPASSSIFDHAALTGGLGQGREPIRWRY